METFHIIIFWAAISVPFSASAFGSRGIIESYWHREDIYSHCIRPFIAYVLYSSALAGILLGIGQFFIDRFIFDIKNDIYNSLLSILTGGVGSFLIARHCGKMLYARNVYCYESMLSERNIDPPNFVVTGVRNQTIKNLKTLIPFTDMKVYTCYAFSGEYIAMDKHGRLAKVRSGMSVREFIDAALKSGIKPIKIGNCSYNIGKTTFHFEFGYLTEKEELS